MSIAGDLLAAQADLLSQGGNSLTFEDTAGDTRTVRGTVNPFGMYDGELINAIGIEGRKIQVGNISPAPQKFDRVTDNVTGMTYVLHDVRAAVVDDTLIGYTCIGAAV